MKREAVGYLKGRGGPGTLGPEEAQAEWREVFAGIRQAVDELEAQALEAEAVIGRVGKALQRSQPRMYREVAVRWWRKQTGGRREPVLVRLDGGAGGKLKPTEMARNSALRRDRGFGLNADLAKEAVNGYWAAASIRAEVAEAVKELRRLAGTGAKRRGEALGRVAEMAERVHAEATQRLRDVGYDFPEGDEEAPVEDWSGQQ